MNRRDEIIEKIRDFIYRYAKILIAVAIIAVVAILVVVVLNLTKGKDGEQTTTEPVEESVSGDDELSLEDLVVPLAENSEADLEALLKSYYACLSNGDMTTLTALCDTIEEKELLRYEEQAQYLTYSVEEIYTQLGPLEGSYVAYVYCKVVFDSYPEVFLPAYNGFYVKTDEMGEMYVVKGELTDSENAYISVIASQDDVIELNNRVTVEYNDIILENPIILDYLTELDTLVNTAVGEKLAAQNASAGLTEGGDADNPQEQEGQEPTQETPTVQETQYATAVTTVNVRASDSENADKLGKLQTANKVEVVEVQVNGWTKVIFEGKTGFIKSEFLTMTQSAAGLASVGKVKANATVNVRSAADQNSDRLGVIAEGESADLIAVENGWCKIKYKAQIGYVKSDYVTTTMNE